MLHIQEKECVTMIHTLSFRRLTAPQKYDSEHAFQHRFQLKLNQPNRSVRTAHESFKSIASGQGCPVLNVDSNRPDCIDRTKNREYRQEKKQISKTHYFVSQAHFQALQVRPSQEEEGGPSKNNRSSRERALSRDRHS